MIPASTFKCLGLVLQSGHDELLSFLSEKGRRSELRKPEEIEHSFSFHFKYFPSLANVLATWDQKQRTDNGTKNSALMSIYNKRNVPCDFFHALSSVKYCFSCGVYYGVYCFHL